MAIIKSNSNALRLQLKNNFPTDRVGKSVQCLPYAVGDDARTPPPGRISFFPRPKPIEVTAIRVASTTILGNDISQFLEYTTEGGLVISYRDEADYFSAFQLSSVEILDDGKAVEYTISDVLNSDGVSFFPHGKQICLSALPAPLSDAFSIIDGGYY